ncbi:uncharacterized protein [Solanum lycopersicum]|uniref:UBR-type domain-containing protein n=1 Tax=Solanum lycopersicum TaxID=4081 RepID=A0A3Q7HWR1_SOLLC|nr:putative E3 ubiquitin-protein ligase UBR7 [Solanum lycopersicum]
MADAFEEDGENTVSIGEFLQDLEEQELEAGLVLGGDEGKECTYSKGYMKRQAIFSCLTCTPDGIAGVCTACSLSCHDGHEILELWTKRNFRCDCGNSKFGEFFCKLDASKDVENTKNSYNHNFKGSYCTCGRPYPDPDVEDQLENLQCCICEDWFHEEHLGLESSDMVPRDDKGEPQFEDLICQGCATVCSFLKLYPDSIFAPVQQQTTTNSSKDKEVVEDAPLTVGSSKELINGSSAIETPVTDNSPKQDCNGKTVLGENAATNTFLNQCNTDAGPSTKCVVGLNLLEAPNSLEKSKSMFLSKDWREVLCRCPNCIEFYKQKGLAFLLDKEDTIAEYEKLAKQKIAEHEQEQSAELLNNLGHVEKMEVLTGIADLKDEIGTYLASFDPSKPVTSADVHKIFENLAQKRRRMS